MSVDIENSLVTRRMLPYWKKIVLMTMMSRKQANTIDSRSDINL